MDRSRKPDPDSFVTDPDRAAAIMIGYPDCRVLDVDEDADGLHVSVETAVHEASCPSCGSVATLKGRSVVVRHPTGLMFGRPMELSWQLRRWRCAAPGCTTGSWTEDVPSSARGD